MILYLGCIREKSCILHNALISSIASSDKCLELYFILLFIFLSKPKTLYKLFKKLYKPKALQFI